MELATGTKLGKDFKKNNLEYCSNWLAIEYKKLDRSLIVTVFLHLSNMNIPFEYNVFILAKNKDFKNFPPYKMMIKCYDI